MRGWVLGLVVVLGAVACAGEVSCPEGREKIGKRCVALDEDGNPSSGELLDGGGQGAHPDGGAVAPDGGADGGAQLACLADLDGDGYGATASEACEDGLISGDCSDSDPTVHPGAVDSCADGVDRDCDGQPGTAESCNGVDDDCDSVADNGFSCAQAATDTACTTSCGTTGTGMCTAECGVPAADACTPPAEVCNWQDENCDGVVDEGLAARLSTNGFAQHGVAQDASIQVALVAKKGGGAWALSSATTLNNTGALEARELDGSGIPVGTSRLLAGTDHMQLFVADSDGQFVAVLGRLADADSSKYGSSLVLIVYDALNLAPVWQRELKKFTDDAGSEDNCERLYPLAVSILTSASGQPYVAAGYGMRTVVGTGVSATCDTNADPDGMLEVLSSGFGSVYAVPVSLNPSPARSLRGLIDIVKVPCREEWLVALSGGAPVIRLLPGAPGAPTGIFAHAPLAASACNGDTSWVVLGEGNALSHHAVNTSTGALSKVASRPVLSVQDTILEVSGRWFAVGVSAGSRQPGVREFTWGQGAQERELKMAVNPADPQVGVYWPNTELQGLMLPRGLSGAMYLNQSIVALFGIGNNGSTFESVGGGRTRAAISYRFGCN